MDVLLQRNPTPGHRAGTAPVAVAMRDGPRAGLAARRTQRWPQRCRNYHCARPRCADLLRVQVSYQLLARLINKHATGPARAPDNAFCRGGFDALELALSNRINRKKFRRLSDFAVLLPDSSM